MKRIILTALLITTLCSVGYGIMVIRGRGFAVAVVEASWTDPHEALLKLRIEFDTTNSTQFLDTSGNNYHGTNNGGVGREIIGTNENGRVEYGGRFDGSGSFLNFANEATVGGATSRTATFWFKPDPGAGNIDTIYFAGASSGALKTYQLTWDVLVNQDLYMAFRSRAISTGADAVITGSWAHVAFTYDGGVISTNTVLIFVDGVQQDTERSGGADGASATALENVTLGKDPVTSGRVVDGLIDQFNLYEGTNLNQAEIQNHVDFTHPTNNILNRT